jgi:mannose-6-phosphate isomerase-like protein (cupin superfamily)
MSGYTIKRVADVADVLGDYPGEMQLMSGPLETEQVAVTYRRMPQYSGGKGSHGHYHRTQEELYFVFSGRLLFKLDDEVVEVVGPACVRVPPSTARSIWNDDPEDGHLLIISTKLPADAPEDAVLVENFWPE